MAGDDQALRAELRQIAAGRARWGYRRAHHELCRQDWGVNRKRVQRLWREQGLRVPARALKRRRPAEETDLSQLRATTEPTPYRRAPPERRRPQQRRTRL